jgi:phosphopantetheinyl transferase
VSTDIHVWLASPGRLAEAAARLLPERERDEAQRYCFRADGHAFLASRCLVRLAAAQYFGRVPEEMILGHSAEGTPLLTCSGGDSATVSLSRRRGVVAVAIAGTAGIGIDVEEAQARGNPVEALSPFLHPACLRDVSEWLQRDGPAAFARLWTLIEACAKATEQGLAAWTGDLIIRRSAEESYVLCRGDEYWHGWPLPAPPRYAASLVWSGGMAGRRILVHDAVDLLDQRPAFRNQGSRPRRGDGGLDGHALSPKLILGVKFAAGIEVAPSRPGGLNPPSPLPGHSGRHPNSAICS